MLFDKASKLERRTRDRRKMLGSGVISFAGGRSTLAMDDYVAAGWDAGDVQEYTQAYYDNFYAPTMLTYLRIPGTFEYWDILDKNLSATMAGEFSAQEALDSTAATWEEITDRLGRDEQLRLYHEAIGYGG